MLYLLAEPKIGTTLEQSQAVSEWIKRDGFLIVFGSVVLVFGMIFFSMWLRNYWANTRHNGERRRRAADLLSHPFFGTMELYLKTKVLTLNLPEKGREAIFRDFLKFKFQVFIANVYSWLVSHQSHLNSMETETLHNEMLKMIAEGIEEYERRALAEGIPQIVLDKFRRFHEDHVAIVTQSIQNICQCEWLLATNTERVAFILNTLTNSFEQTLVDAEMVLCSINGELNGVVYKGVTVQPFQHRRYVKGESGIHKAL